VVSSDVTQPFGPRICADAVKDEFTTLDRVNTVASTIAFDATNGVVKAPHGANGYQTGELYTTELQPGVDARVVKLGWTGSGVTFYVSTDGNTWSQLQKDQPLSLGTSTRSLYLKAVLAADASSVLDRYLLQINPTGFNLFTGKMLTEETGLVYFGARWYDPEIGRWITPDPSEDGENWYGYCNNNPLRYTDPNGLYAGGDDFAAFLGGGLIGAGIEFGFQAWNNKYDITKVFTVFLKGGLSAWVGLYTGPGGIGVYSFLDAVEVGVRAKLAGQSISLTNFAQVFATDMISGVAGGALGKGIAKLAGRLAPKITQILSEFKNSKFVNQLADEIGAINPGGFSKPFQNHHWINQATEKGVNPHDLILEANKLGISIRTEEWNIESIAHQGGHTNEYYSYVRKQLSQVYEQYVASGCNWDAATNA
jgi:RHS repeat-associated protein